MVFCEVKIKLELKTSHIFYSPFPLISSSHSILLTYFIQDQDLYGYLYSMYIHICVYPYVHKQDIVSFGLICKGAHLWFALFTKNCLWHFSMLTRLNLVIICFNCCTLWLHYNLSIPSWHVFKLFLVLHSCQWCHSKLPHAPLSKHKTQNSPGYIPENEIARL